MNTKNNRLDIRTTHSAKETLEQAANMVGTTLSAFMLDSAMSRARDIIAQNQTIHLNHKESERFVSFLQQPPKPNEKLKALFKKHK